MPALVITAWIDSTGSPGYLLGSRLDIFVGNVCLFFSLLVISLVFVVL
jgi:hypothetical protein